MHAWRVTIRSRRYTTEMTYLGIAANAIAACRAAKRCAHRDKIRAPYIGEFECVGTIDFDTSWRIKA